ncbi:Transcription initiation factor TFIID subunit 9B [Dirofilaria immitis]|nr:Transcription initiation factor TFIID subunit 9B [Dirofilaria immitis]
MGTIPHDAQVMEAILKDMEITDYEPRVISQMLEFAYRCTAEILEDARSISEHAGKKQIDEADVQFAIDNAELFHDSVVGGAWPFLVGGVICLVYSDNERDSNLLNSFWKSERPSRQLLVEFAEQKNATPLPPIRQNYGLRLPNDRFCLIQPNVGWKSNEQLREINEQMIRKEEPTVRPVETIRQTRPEAITNLLKRKAPDDEDFDVP